MNADTTNLYGYNLEFLKKHITVIELKRGNSALALVPAWQGRVMTSTAQGDNGYSFGWINRELIESGKLQPHINAFGGEERFWLGPEGGQFSVFFSQGSEFTFDDWQTPEFIDTMPYEVVSKSDTDAVFRASASLVNYSGTKFDILAERKVKLLSAKSLSDLSGIDPGGLNWVAYTSDNLLRNTGREAWKKETGLLSVWMLGMFNPSPTVVVVIPVKEGGKEELGPMVNDNYFGAIPPERLKVIGRHVFFRADGKSRGKIGIPPLRVSGVMGSYDSGNNILTLLFCRLPEGKTEYVNSAWEIQKDPFSGDAFNSYNDGPLADGSQMGPFYELETSSPAAFLKPGGELLHSQTTVHLTGERLLIDSIARKVLGVSIDEIEKAFNK